MTNIYTTAGRARKLGGPAFSFVLFASTVLAIAATYLALSHSYSALTPYQKFYYPQYKRSLTTQYTTFKKEGLFTLFTYTLADPKTKKQSEYLWLEKEMVFDTDAEGNIKLRPDGYPNVQVRLDAPGMQGKTYFQAQVRKSADVYKALKDSVYDGSDFYELFYFPLGAGVLSFFIFLAVGYALVNKLTDKKLESVVIRGVCLFSVKDYYRRTRKAMGFFLLVRAPEGLQSWRSRQWCWVKEKIYSQANIYRLRIPQEAEAQGTLILGDSGTGKSVLIHQIIDCARTGERREPGICYDPAAEFVQYHYKNPNDVILNPHDQRFPNWELSDEIRTSTDLDLIAESFFPSRFIRDNQSRFFNQAAQDVFKLILKGKPTNEQIIRIICDEKLIDETVKGTEIAQKVALTAGPQRAAVISSLADLGKVLRQIPPPQKGKRNFSLTEWANGDVSRTGWLFFTMMSDTRDSLRPLFSAMLNILMRRLMSIPQRKRANNPAWWFVADELHTLNSLPVLPDFTTECRKHGVRYVFGTQSKHQLVSQYNEEAWTIIAQSKLKIFYRTNEPQSAKWVADCIGQQEIDRAQVSASVSASGAYGKDSVSVQTVNQNRILLMPEEIMSLPDLHGVWKRGNDVVPFRLQYIDRNATTEDFIKRDDDPFGKSTEAHSTLVTQSAGSVQVSYIDTSEQPEKAKAEHNREAISHNRQQPENIKEPQDQSRDIRLDF